MRKLLILCAVWLACEKSGYGQKYVYQKITLARDGVSASVGYIGMGSRYTQLYKKGTMVGFADLGWNITDKWLIGGTANFLLTEVKIPYNTYEPVPVTQKIENRFGLIKLAYTHQTYKLWHPVIGVGFGGAEIKAHVVDKDVYQFYNASFTYAALIEPYVEFELNVSKRFRPVLGFSYLRSVYQTNERSFISDSQISSANIYISARFGEF